MSNGRRFGLTEAQAQRWAAIRRRGRPRSVLVDGVLFGGILLAVPWSAIMHWLNAPGLFLGNLAVALMVFPSGGAIFAAWRWSFHERRYLRRRERHSSFCMRLAGATE